MKLVRKLTWEGCLFPYPDWDQFRNRHGKNFRARERRGRIGIGSGIWHGRNFRASEGARIGINSGIRHGRNFLARESGHGWESLQMHGRNFRAREGNFLARERERSWIGVSSEIGTEETSAPVKVISVPG